MAFVKFTKVGRSFATKVSLSPRGMLSFNDGARHKHEIDKYSYSVLYYDKERSVIGVELTNDKDAEGALKIRFRKTGADLGVKSFIDYFELVPEVTTMYAVEVGDDENWINIDLNTGRQRKIKSD